MRARARTFVQAMADWAKVGCLVLICVLLCLTLKTLQRYTCWGDSGGKGGEIVLFWGGAGAACRIEVVGCISSEQNVWSPRLDVGF